MGTGRRTECAWWNNVSKWITVTSLGTAGKYNSTEEDAKTIYERWSHIVFTICLPNRTWAWTIERTNRTREGQGPDPKRRLGEEDETFECGSAYPRC